MMTLLLAPALTIAAPDVRWDAKCTAVLKAWLASFPNDKWTEERQLAAAGVAFYVGRLTAVVAGPQAKMLVDASASELRNKPQAELVELTTQCFGEMSKTTKAAGV